LSIVTARLLATSVSTDKNASPQNWRANTLFRAQPICHINRA
jgi:hypothetical protein